MKQYGNRREVEKDPTFNALHPMVQDRMIEILVLLEIYYGEDRNIENDLGGYVVLIEDEKDISTLKAKKNIDLKTTHFEYVDIVGDYLDLLVLVMSDYSVSILIPIDLATQRMIDNC